MANVKYETKIRLPEAVKNELNQLRDDSKFDARIVIEPTGTGEIIVECESSTDAVLISLKFS